MDFDILIVGQGGNTGYARVLKNIALQLSKHYKIIYFAHNLHTEVRSNNYITENNKVIGDILGVLQLPELIQKYNPKIIFMCHDYWFYDVHYENLKRLEYDNKVIFYCPVDECAPYINRANILKNVAYLIFYTSYGKQMFIREWELAGFKDKKINMPKIEVIPHGVEREKFFPIEGGQKRARQILFPDKTDMEDSFIILNANRNTPRKRIDLTLKGFSLFVKDRPPNIYLCLHMQNRDCGINILDTIKELEIEERIIFITAESTNQKIMDEQLNLIYNACEVGINTSSGEGWGLVSFEHAATGAAQIVPNHTSCSENWSQYGLLIDLENDNSKGVISINHLAMLLSNLYDNREMLSIVSEKALCFSKNKIFNWEIIGERWTKVFNRFL